MVLLTKQQYFLFFNIGSQEKMDFSGDVLPKVRRRRQAVNVVAVNRCSPNLMRSNTGDLLEICKFDMLRIKYRSLDGRLPPEVSQWYWFPLIGASTSSNSDIHRSQVNFHLGFVESSSDIIYLTNFTDSFSMIGQSALRREFLWRIFFLQKLYDIAGRPNK